MMAAASTPAGERKLERLRYWIFAYFLLLVFEGVLRKWLSLGFLVSSALLLVRDPIIVVIYYLAWKARVFPKHRLMKIWAVTLVVMSLLAMLQVFFHPWLKLLVAAYGIRSYCLHVPLIFIMARVFRREDIARVGRWTLMLAGPMVLLMVAQFFSPPGSFLNRATLGEGSQQIGAALGRIRPAGTFSYGTGATSFNLLVAAFLIYSFVDTSWVSKRVRWVAAAALVTVMPISGSRTFVLSLGLILCFAFVGGAFNRRLLFVTSKLVLAGAVCFILLTLTPFFREGLLTFATRWEHALGPSGSFNEAIIQRFLGEYIHAFESLGTAPLLGYGLGLASNVGTALTVRSLGFLLAESEWERAVMEMGPFVALFWLGTRTAFGILLYRRAWRCATRGEALPWLLLSTECTAIFNGLLEQTTSLGFIIFTTGLLMAAIQVSHHESARATAIGPRATALPDLAPQAA
jgi:hypothetical protein